MIKEVFRATLDLLDQPLLISSGDTPGSSRVLYSNPALHRVSGFGPETLLGLPISATLADPLWLAGPFDESGQGKLGEITMPMKKADGTVQLARWRVDCHPGEDQLYVVLVAPFATRGGDEKSFPR